MVQSNEHSVGFDIDYIRVLLGQTCHSFSKMLNIDYDYYVSNVVKSPILFGIKRDVLYRLYYAMSEVGSNCYATNWIRYPAKNVVSTIRKRIDEQVEYDIQINRNLQKKEPQDSDFNTSAESRFTSIHLLLNQSASTFCLINGISVDEYNYIVNSIDLSDLDSTLVYKIYFVLKEILNNKYINGEVINICNEYIKSCDKSIVSYMNSDCDINVRTKDYSEE